MARSEIRAFRTFCPFCGISWQVPMIIFGKAALIHSCKERNNDWVGWFNDPDSIPFDVPDKYMEWS